MGCISWYIRNIMTDILLWHHSRHTLLCSLSSKPVLSKHEVHANIATSCPATQLSFKPFSIRHTVEVCMRVLCSQGYGTQAPFRPAETRVSKLLQLGEGGSVWFCGDQEPWHGESKFISHAELGWVDQTEQETNQPGLILGLFTQWANGGMELKKCERWKKGKGRAHAFGLGQIWSE